MASNLLLKSGGAFAGQSKAPIMDLYRSICREIPRVLTIYDVDIDPALARRKVNLLFRKHADVKDDDVIQILVSKGYMELEETVLQYKQKTHLMRILGTEQGEYRVPQAPPQQSNFFFKNIGKKYI
mmetsp:Transcript_10612/g.15903  ORF Transcript_10612/g.15903 Transcript_10612/m.15903 type:complete len:126 (+) Transcript_10612:60-437(+)